MSTDTMSDVLVKTTDLPWVPLAEGIDYRVLRTSPETGTWTVLLRAQAGSSFAKHRHLGPGEYFMIKGRMEYRAGCAVAGEFYSERNPILPLDDLNRFDQARGPRHIHALEIEAEARVCDDDVDIARPLLHN